MKCEICQQDFNHLGLHIKYKHKNLTDKSYYDTFIKSSSDGICVQCHKFTKFISLTKGYAKFCCQSCAQIGNSGPAVGHSKQKYDKTKSITEGICLTCGKPTKFISANKGYEKYCSLMCDPSINNDDIVTCMLCGKELLKGAALGNHITQFHKQSTKDYYDKYIKQLNEGYCEKCGNITDFISFAQGYKKLCSNCSYKQPDTYKCLICGEYLRNVGRHFSITHHMSVKDYYDSYIKDKNDGLCKICGKPTSFISIRSGYKEFCKQHTIQTPIITCELCGFSCKVSAFCTHLKIHNLSGQEYYDKYLKKENEDICIVCSKPTKYLGLTKGYQKTCSAKCSKKVGIETYKQTCLVKYGVDNTQKVPEIREKVIKTNKERYGGCGFQSPKSRESIKNRTAEQVNEANEKRRQTMIDRFGVPNASQSAELNEKRKATLIAHYGVTETFASSEIRKKSEQTMIEKYGVAHPIQNDQIKQQIQTTMTNRYGVPFTAQSEQLTAKMKQTNLEKYGNEYAIASGEVRSKIQQTWDDKYGGHPAQNSEILQKMQNTQRENHDGKLAWNTDKQKQTLIENNKLDSTLSEDDL